MRNPLSKTTLTAVGTGPGAIQTELVQCSDSELAVTYSAEVSGNYSLVVSCKTSGEVCLLFNPIKPPQYTIYINQLSEKLISLDSGAEFVTK